MKLAGALITAILIVGLALGAGQAAASSLPGDPLYGLKLAMEAVRLQLTTDPEAQAALATDLAAERLDEIATLIAQRQPLGEPTIQRARTQLALSLQAANQVQGQEAVRAAERLRDALQKRQQLMTQAAEALPERDRERLRELLRDMDRVRQELHTGQGEPSGEQHQLRPGAPPDPSQQPGSGAMPTEAPFGPRPTEAPAVGPGPQPTAPVGPGPTEVPGFGPGPQPTTPVGPMPTERPLGPKPAENPGFGPGPQPTATPVGPGPSGDPGAGPGPQPTEPPGGPGPQPTQGPGGGGSQGNPPDDTGRTGGGK